MPPWQRDEAFESTPGAFESRSTAIEILVHAEHMRRRTGAAFDHITTSRSGHVDSTLVVDVDHGATVGRQNFKQTTFGSGVLGH